MNSALSSLVAAVLLVTGCSVTAVALADMATPAASHTSTVVRAAPAVPAPADGVHLARACCRSTDSTAE